MNFIIKIIYSRKEYTYISASEQCKDFCFRKRKRVQIISNQVEIQEYVYNENVRNEYRKKFGFKEDSFVIGNIGRFEKQKNHKFLLEIFQKIQEKNKNAYLILIGSGKLEDRIKTLIKKRKINNVMILKERTDINKILQMLDVYVSTSKYEGFGLTVLAAQAASLPTYCLNTLPKEVQRARFLRTMPMEASAAEWAKLILKDKNFKRKLCEINGSIDEYAGKIADLF